MFEHRCIRNVYSTWCVDLVSNSGVGCRVLGRKPQSHDETPNVNGLKCLVLVLRMLVSRLLWCTSFSETQWLEDGSRQQKGMGIPTIGLSQVGRIIIQGWAPCGLCDDRKLKGIWLDVTVSYVLAYGMFLIFYSSDL